MTASPSASDAGYVLYGTPGSGSAIVEIGLRWCGQSYRTMHASSWESGSEQDALRALNPLMQIPTLHTPDGDVLTESGAILMHLGLRFPAAGLLGDSDRRRDQILRGLVYIAANCYAGIGILDYPDRWYPDPDDAVKEKMQARGRARLHELWELFADQFPATPWLSGERLGALDILAATVSMWSGARKALAQSRPAFSGLLARIEADPRVAAVWARHWPKH